jgi:hypothetical protein
MLALLILCAADVSLLPTVRGSVPVPIFNGHDIQDDILTHNNQGSMVKSRKRERKYSIALNNSIFCKIELTERIT